jgi:vacuolar-type H+-ATPase subunit I/STV1
MMDDRRKIGVGLTGFGFLFTFLGVVFFFDKGLLAMGNILFVAGVAMTIGTQATIRFFLRPKNHRGSACFLLGFMLVVWGWAIIGFVAETYGFFLLFRGFFPTVLSFLRNVPFLGRLLDAPALKTVINRIAPAQTLPV